jgi:hypothetical protein
MGILHKSQVETRVTSGLLSDEGADPRHNSPRNSGFSFVARLGRLSVATLVASFTVCLGCIAFLTFLWAAQTSNVIWRMIIVSGWTTRSITISALALRWATATQAILCTSMLAAILLQMGAVPLPSAAAISIMRVDNTGPWSLLGVMKARWHSTSLFPGLITMLLSLTTLCLQFTSTALLSNVGLAFLPTEISESKTFYRADPDGRTFGSQLSAVRSYLETTPTGYPAFAEWIATETPSVRYGEYVPNNTQGIRDTGTVMRAFLPFSDVDTRNRLTEYTGFGTVVDMRVVCMRPQLTDIVYSTMSGFRLTGSAEVPQKPQGFVQPANAKYVLSFDCGFAAVSSKNSSDWSLALCGPQIMDSQYDQGSLTAYWAEKRMVD